MPEPVPGPSGPGSVVLDLGPGIGALILHTPPELDGREIEISPAGRTPGRRTHARVRPRKTGGGTQYAAVYPRLAAGNYTIRADHDTALAAVTITSGQVTTTRWPGRDPAADPPAASTQRSRHDIVSADLDHRPDPRG